MTDKQIIGRVVKELPKGEDPYVFADVDMIKAIQLARQAERENFQPSLKEIGNGLLKCKSKRIQQGFLWGVSKAKIYSLGFEDAIEWLNEET